MISRDGAFLITVTSHSDPERTAGKIKVFRSGLIAGVQEAGLTVDMLKSATRIGGMAARAK